MHTAEIALARASWQSHLFAERPSRLELLKLQARWPLIKTAVRVHRNHSFEHVAAAAGPWFAFGGYRVDYSYSDYDDSLSFEFSKGAQADVEFVWLDAARYVNQFSGTQFAEWVMGRLLGLRLRSDSPIVLAMTGADQESQRLLAKSVRGLPGVRMAELGLIQEELGSRFFDDRAAAFSGTRLSDAACVLVAREFACRWAPAMLRVRLKAIVVDLDNTLFEGVLGEDSDRVELTVAHEALQRCLLRFREQGVFLALVSRNELEDVKALFESRKDFPLRWEHFSATAVNWGSKPQNILQIAKLLRIGADAMLFVDDNPGELAAVASEVPEASLLHADRDAAMTRRALDYYPGLWTWHPGETDTVRAADMQAEVERARLSAECSEPLEYLRSLRVRLQIHLTPRQHLARLHELSQKTNQFNLNLERYSEVDLARLLDADDHRIVLIGLSDRLSDSGLIGLLVARREGNTLTVRELAISCRALGRRLEDLMVAEALRAMLKELPCENVEFLHRTGPRNGPAREWLGRLTGQASPPEGRATAHGFLTGIRSKDYPVDIEIVCHEADRN